MKTLICLIILSFIVVNCSQTIDAFKKPIYLKRLKKESFKEKVEIKFIDESHLDVIFTNISKDSITIINLNYKEQIPLIRKIPLSKIKYIKIPDSENNDLLGLVIGFGLGYSATFIDPNRQYRIRDNVWHSWRFNRAAIW